MTRLDRRDASVVSVEGRLAGLPAEELAQALEAVLQVPLPLVVDLAAMTGLTGSGLGALVKAHARAAGAGRSLQVQNAPVPVAALLQATGLASGLGVAVPAANGSSSALEGWMPPLDVITVGQAPAGARNLNVHGRRPSGPFQGFGPLWHKTYTLRVGTGSVTPEGIVEMLRTRLPELQPASNRFFPVGGKMAPVRWF